MATVPQISGDSPVDVTAIKTWLLNLFPESNATLFTSANAIAQILMPYAKTTLALLAALTTAWYVVRWMADGNKTDRFLQNWIETTLYILVFVFLLLNYQAIFIDAIPESFNVLDFQIRGDSSKNTNSMLTLAGMMFTQPAAIKSSMTTLADIVNISWIIKNVIFLVAGVVALIAAIFHSLSLNIGLIMASIGLSLGPMFIAVGCWRVTNQLFQGWLMFIVASLMVKLVSSVMGTIIMQMTEQMMQMSNGLISLTGSLMVLMYCIFVLFLSTLVIHIANGIVRGAASVSIGIGLPSKVG